MTALGMRLALRRLRKSHGIATPHPVTIPFTLLPTARAQVLSGYAATRDTDLQRQQFWGWAFGAVHRYAPPPLYYKHDQSRGEVGTIDSLSYDDHGALQITATVTDVAIASSLTAPFYHLKRRLCSGFSDVYIFQGWIGNSRVTCSGCSLDRLVISMLCRPLCRQVTF